MPASSSTSSHPAAPLAVRTWCANASCPDTTGTCPTHTDSALEVLEALIHEDWIREPADQAYFPSNPARARAQGLRPAREAAQTAILVAAAASYPRHGCGRTLPNSDPACWPHHLPAVRIAIELFRDQWIRTPAERAISPQQVRAQTASAPLH